MVVIIGTSIGLIIADNGSKDKTYTITQVGDETMNVYEFKSVKKGPTETKKDIAGKFLT